MKDSSSDTSASSFSTEIEDFHDQSAFRINMDAGINLADTYRLPPPGFESPIKDRLLWTLQVILYSSVTRKRTVKTK